MATNNEKNIKYWLQRTTERRLINSEDIGNRAIKDVVKLYEQALRNINDSINSIYVNYSKNVGLSVDELTHIISGTERASFFKSIQANMQRLGFNVDQIYNERYIYRLSRLDALKQQIYWEIAALAPQETTITGRAYIDIIDQTYRDAIEGRRLAFSNAVTPSFATLNRTVIKGMLEERWHEGNYQTSVWGNVGVLGDRVQAIIGGVFDKDQRYRIHDVLPQAIGGALTMGQSYQKTSRMLNDIFEVGKYNATRLVRTESNYFENQAELESMVDDGIERYEFYAVMDNRTSRICQEHDGEVVNVEDAQVGKNYPPLHPNCRSTAMPLLAGEKKYKRLRPDAWANSGEDAEPADVLQQDTKTKSVNERWKEAMAKQMNPNKAVHDFNADLNRITREYKGQDLINELGKLVAQVPETDPLKPAIVSTAKLMGWSDDVQPQIPVASGKQISAQPTIDAKQAIPYGDWATKFDSSWQQAIQDAVAKVPKDALPDTLSTGADFQKITDRAIGRGANEWYGITVEQMGIKLPDDQITAGDRANVKSTKPDSNGRVFFDDGTNKQIMAFNTRQFTTTQSLTDYKQQFNTKYLAQTGNKAFLNDTGEATVVHEFGHAYQNRTSIAEGSEWKQLHRDWIAQDKTFSIQSSGEAFSEAFANYYTKNGADLPENIRQFIEAIAKKEDILK